MSLTLDGDDQLRDDWEHLGAALLEHVKDALHGEEAVWVLLLADSFEEDGQVMMVVQLGHVDLPVDFVLGPVLDGNGQVSAVVEATELTGDDVSSQRGASFWLRDFGLWLWHGLAGRHSTGAFSLFER